MTGYVRSAPSFTQMPQVMDGASQMMIDIFGQPCARSAIGVWHCPGVPASRSTPWSSSPHD